MKKKLLNVLALLGFSLFTNAQIIENFDRIALDSNSYWHAQNTLDTLLNNHLITITSEYDTVWNYWSGGFALSNKQDSSTSGYLNMYATKGLTGYKGTSNYLVGKNYSRIQIKKHQHNPLENKLKGFYVNNSTYAYNSMRDGDAFAKKFGGPSGNDPDFFLLTVKGYHHNMPLTDSVNFYLADYRSPQNSEDYIIKNWTYIDVSALDEADELEFILTSSDVGMYGMNTPAFFCLDQLVFEEVSDSTNYSTFDDILTNPNTVINQFPNNHFMSNQMEFDNNYDTTWNYMSSGFAVSTQTDSVTQGFTNMYSSKSGNGYKSQAYGVVYGEGTIKINGTPLKGFFVNNNTYAYYSMLQGDAFAKKFGGVSGNDPDYFKIIITRKGDTQHPDLSKEFYLADYRFQNNQQDYIIKDWTWVDLSDLLYNDEYNMTNFYNGEYEITFAGSDTGAFGLNTPMYVCIDGVTPYTTTGTVNINKQATTLFSIYPNPATSFIKIQGLTNYSQIEIVNLEGKKLKVTLKNDTLDLSELPSGLYFILINDNLKTTSIKFVKQ